MKILITTMGSAGDVHPFLALALALKRHGHQPVILVNPHFLPLVASLGLTGHACGREFHLREIADNPDLMHPTKGPKVIWRDFVIPNAPMMLDAAESAVRDVSPDIVIGHPIYCVTRWVCERYRLPFVSVALTPLLWFSKHEVPVMLPWESDRPSRAWVYLRDIIGRLMLRSWIDKPLNKLRRQRGLAPEWNQLIRGCREGDLNLALWSAHFRPTLPDDPPNGRICGFPWFDGRNGDRSLDPGLQRFLSKDDPPIVFTLGSTAVHVAGDFYHHAAEACRLLNRRGLMLTGDTARVPRDLPPEVMAVESAPHSLVLPRGCATVVHGGIGTTAQAMRAGKPLVVVPFSHDQFDNAARARRLGLSTTLKRGKVTAATLASALRTVLEDGEYARRAAEFGAAIGAEDGAETAAIAIETAFAEG